MSDRCKQCGAALTERDAFCTKCGAQRNEAAAPAAAKRFCTKCGAVLPSGTKFCTKCGLEVGAGAASSVTTASATPNSAAHAYGGRVLAESAAQRALPSPTPPMHIPKAA